MWRLQKIALDAEHELPSGRVNVLRLQPREVFLQHVIGQGGEKRFQLKKRRLLLDNSVDPYVADPQARDHRPNTEIGMLTRGGWPATVSVPTETASAGSSVAPSRQNGRLICYSRRSMVSDGREAGGDRVPNNRVHLKAE